MLIVSDPVFVHPLGVLQMLSTRLPRVATRSLTTVTAARRVAAPLATTASSSSTRTLATVSDSNVNPVRRYGGLKDQDRIFR